MICLTPKSRQKISEIVAVSLWPLSTPDLNPLDYAIWGVLENKTNATSHSNIGSLMTAVGEELNRMSEEFILKSCKSFRRRVHAIIEKKKMVAILSKFTVLCLSYFVVYFLELILCL